MLLYSLWMPVRSVSFGAQVGVGNEVGEGIASWAGNNEKLDRRQKDQMARGEGFTISTTM